jgi:hypothetical protein
MDMGARTVQEELYDFGLREVLEFCAPPKRGESRTKMINIELPVVVAAAAAAAVVGGGITAGAAAACVRARKNRIVLRGFGYRHLRNVNSCKWHGS